MILYLLCNSVIETTNQVLSGYVYAFFFCNKFHFFDVAYQPETILSGSWYFFCFYILNLIHLLGTSMEKGGVSCNFC